MRIVHVDSDPKWGDDGHRRQLVGVAELSRLQPGRRRWPHRPDRRGRQTCSASIPRSALHATAPSQAGGNSIAYGDIVARGDLRRTYTPEQLKEMPIKSAAERRLIGRDTTALDVPPKTNGEARYGLDASVDGMIYARPKVPPTRNDSKVVSIDDSAAKSVPGYIQSRALDDPSGTAPGWVMVYADSFIAAEPRSRSREGDVELGGRGQCIRADLQRHAAELIADPKGGALVVNDPGVDAAFASAKADARAHLHDQHRHAFRAGADQCLGIRKGRHLRNPYRQSVAVADPAGAGQGAGPQPGHDRAAHLLARRRIRPSP